eukprot:TRINITY_DN881_c0_g1_i1.p1 TRINITY_DN881_c0_g1~~TRINITY_DN881_c0_g1_i1.p1  ORF type:complete len:811 (+),score=361.92 TRINITY_DN881_c0_g1_i1:122-2434(+)
MREKYAEQLEEDDEDDEDEVVDVPPIRKPSAFSVLLSSSKDEEEDEEDSAKNKEKEVGKQSSKLASSARPAADPPREEPARITASDGATPAGGRANQKKNNKKNKRKNKKVQGALATSEDGKQGREKLLDEDDELLEHFSQEMKLKASKSNQEDAQKETESLLRVSLDFLDAEDELKRLFGRNVGSSGGERRQERGDPEDEEIERIRQQANHFTKTQKKRADRYIRMKQQQARSGPKKGPLSSSSKKLDKTQLGLLPLVKPQAGWPFSASEAGDLKMVLDDAPSKAAKLQSEEGEKGKKFKFVWSKKYETSGRIALNEAIGSGDPNSLVHLLSYYPWQPEALLQLSEICKQIGDYPAAQDFLMRILYCYQRAFSAEALLALQKNECRLLLSEPSNKPLLTALFRWIQMLGRRGCCRSAFECCKMLLTFDPSDPLFISGQIDYFALRSKQFNFLLDYWFQSFRGCGFSTSLSAGDAPQASVFQLQSALVLPNFLYSMALAKWHLEDSDESLSSSSSSSSSSSPSSSSSSSSSSSKEYPSADELLQRALWVFPSAILKILGKAGSLGRLRHPKTMKIVPVDTCDLFLSAYETPSLTRLMELWVERAYPLWTEQRVQDWIATNLAIVVTQFGETGQVNPDPEVQLLTRLVKLKFPADSMSNLDSKISSINASDYNDEIAAIPADALNNPVQAMEPPALRDDLPGYNPENAGNPVVEFFRTLMPWNDGSEPVQQQQQQDRPGIRELIHQMLQALDEENPDLGFEDYGEEDEEDD